MDDPQRKPGEGDRSPLVARIQRAAEQGRIGEADRDIRLGNVASAQTMTELDLMSRELDQLEATLPSAPAAATAWAGPSVPPVADEIVDKAVDTAKATARSIGVVTIAIVVLVLIGAGVSGLVAFRSSTGSSGPSAVLQDPSPIVPNADSPTGPTSAEGSDSATPGGSAYALTGPGIRSFLARYQAQFHTSEVVDLTMYDDYVVVQVPVQGKARHEGWLYRNDSGFTSFGGITANFPGAVPVDTRRLALGPLLRNIARARTTLAVEEPTTTYVIVRFYRGADEAPSVDIHVSNDFQESGYLATTLDGSVERAYPFSS
jgi:hypothetical protein